MSPDQVQNETAESTSAARRLTILYVFALSTVAILSLGAQALIQRQLSNGESDSRVINIAGRQRMLSQRLAKSALQMREAASDNSQPSRELAETLALWSRSHQGLQRGDSVQGLPGDNSPRIAELYAVIEPSFESMKTAAQQLGADTTVAELRDQAVQTIQQHEAVFLAGMDAIVSQYVLEAERKVARLRRLEYAILALTLGVLLAEGLLIFRPAVKRIEQTVERLGTVSDRLRLAKEEAERANAAKTKFLANVSHELRTPMTAVLGMTELARETDDSAQRTRFLSIVEEAGSSLLSLLNDLIDLARIDAGKMVLASASFAPQQVIDRVVRLMGPACERKGVRLSSDTSIGSDYFVRGDARRLEQVLLNLVGNANKWTEEGTILVACELVGQTSKDCTLRFLVTDTGVGIPEADTQQIFEPFAQASKASPVGNGVGLGLAICQRIANAMQAKLNLTSRVGQGTVVTLTGAFPLAVAPNTKALRSDSLPVEDPKTASCSQNILVVEDTEVNQVLLRELLTRAGHQVTIVGTGEEAIATYQQQSFDLAMVDLQLPGIDGATTVQRLIALHQDRSSRPMPCICVTAHADPATQAEELAAGFDAVVTKPINRQALLMTIAKLTNNRTSKNRTDKPTEQSHSSERSFTLEQELAAEFLKVIDDQSSQLKSAVEEKNWPTAKMLAHRLRGQVPYFEATQLEQQLQQLELACVNNATTTAEQILPDIVKGLNRLSDKLRQARHEAY